MEDSWRRLDMNRDGDDVPRSFVLTPTYFGGSHNLAVSARLSRLTRWRAPQAARCGPREAVIVATRTKQNALSFWPRAYMRPDADLLWRSHHLRFCAG